MKSRAHRRHLRCKWIKRRHRDWMKDAPGKLSRGNYMGRGCYCERCVGGRTLWKSVEGEVYRQHLLDNKNETMEA